MSLNDMPVEGLPKVLYPPRLARAEGESDASFVARVKQWQAKQKGKSNASSTRT